MGSWDLKAITEEKGRRPDLSTVKSYLLSYLTQNLKDTTSSLNGTMKAFRLIIYKNKK